MAHLELVAGLPYPASVLMPTVLAAVRRGFDADFGGFGWVSGTQLNPRAYWQERMTARVLQSLGAHQQELFTDFSLHKQLASDGNFVREIRDMPGYESHWMQLDIMAPLGVRWAMGAPVFDAGGVCNGFLYLYRRAEAGQFTDTEQARLRAARDRLKVLHFQGNEELPPAPLREAGMAVISLDANGTLQASGKRALELLYLCQDTRAGVLDWAREDMAALPPSVQAMVQPLLAPDGQTLTGSCTLDLPGGRFEFRADQLLASDGGLQQVVVSITHMEPADIAVARQLLEWPLSIQEKRLVVASVREPSLHALASYLGVTVNTLKSYNNRILAKVGLASRQAFIDVLLSQSAPG